MPRIYLNVDQDCIDRKGKSSDTCPIATAVQKKYPNARVQVNSLGIYIGVGGPKGYMVKNHPLTHSQLKFVNAVDESETVKPTHFLLSTDEEFYNLLEASN